MRLWGTPLEAGLVQVYLAPRTPVDMAASGIIDLGVYLAVTGGSRTGIDKAHLGIEERGEDGLVSAAPTVEISNWQDIGQVLKPVTGMVELGGGFATAAPFLGLEVATGTPIDITLRIGWSFTAPVDPVVPGMQTTPLAFTAL
jgi:hypothetical protein